MGSVVRGGLLLLSLGCGVLADNDGLAILTKRDTSYSSHSCVPSPSPSSLLAWVSELDYSLHSTLQQLPGAVEEAR